MLTAIGFALGLTIGWMVRSCKAEADLAKGIISGPRKIVRPYQPTQEIPAIWR